MTASAPSSTPGSGTPFVTDAGRLLRVLFSPGKVFGEVQEQPGFWMPFAVIALVNAVVTFLMRPFQTRIGQLMAERAGRPAPEPTMLRTVVGVVFSPLGPLILCLIVGGLLYVLVSMFGGQTTYKKMMTVALFTWPLTLLQQLLSFGVLSMRGVESIRGPADMFVSFGADLVLPADAQVGYFTRFLLAGIGPLPIWSVTITAVGLMVLGKVAKGGAWTAALILYAISLLAIAGLGSFGMKMMGG